MPNINDPWLSDFERREISRRQTGEPDAWYVRLRDDGRTQIVGEERLDRNPDWFVSVVFDVGKSDFSLVSMRVDPASLTPPSGGISTNVFRSIRLGPLFARAHNTIQLPTSVGGGLGLVTLDDQGRVPRPGRRGRNDIFYARWAALYVDALAEGPNPLPRLAKAEHLNESTIRGFLHEARRRKLLTDAPPGRAGGQLTRKAETLLTKEWDA